MTAAAVRRDAPSQPVMSSFRLVTIASVALVTMAAYENRATTTILPLVARELGGLRWFGLASAMSAVT